ncbi:hypothetical protein diail_5706 [Diaporthe ilicicola]|nr:hypothetical protein diail_5706 [Diaporthe ilicicola]
MSDREPVEGKPASSSFDWTIGAKVRDGRCGPVYLALRDDTGELIAAEEVVLDDHADSSVLESVASRLESELGRPSLPNVVSYLGYQLREGRMFILTEYIPGGTLQDFVRSYGAIPEPLARSFLRQIVLGLKQLQSHGLAVTFLDSTNVLIDNKGIAKIEAPLLDVTVTGQPLPSAILALPELIRGQQNMRKADIWLVGIIAAQLLTGDCSLAEASSAHSVAARLKQAQESGLELLISRDVASKFSESASDFMRQCLTIDINHRPSISDLSEHSFLDFPAPGAG